MSFSDPEENSILDFRLAAWVTAGGVYLSLHNGSPLDDASGAAATEFALGVDGYARVLHTAWTAAAAGIVRNTGAINFPNPVASWGNATHVGLWIDANSQLVADLKGWGTITPPRVIAAGFAPSFATNALVIQLD